jgi:hypothetical protein
MALHHHENIKIHQNFQINKCNEQATDKRETMNTGNTAGLKVRGESIERLKERKMYVQ